MGMRLFSTNICSMSTCRCTRILTRIWSMILLRSKIFSFLLFIAIINVPWSLFYSPFPLNLFKHASTKSSHKITIGLMICAGGYKDVGRGRNESRAMNAAAEEPLTLIKSVLISARIGKAKHLEFHIFTDSWMLTGLLNTKMQAFKSIMRKFMRIKVYYHNVFKSVPHGYERDFIDNVRRCGYVRVFFPTFLPDSLREILYLDTDVIITGNIVQIWRHFLERVVLKADPKPPQLAALVQNSEVDGKAYLGIFNQHFKRIPHVPPRGVNSGVMFMNLDAMRKLNWTGAIMKIAEERRSTLQGDQQLINIFFHDNLDKLTLFPCQYNFQHLHCERGLSCKSLLTDPAGIQIMHGAGGMFHTRGRSHYQLYQAFKMFNLRHHQEVEARLFTPLIKFYNVTYDKSNVRGRLSCFGLIGKYLFKHHLESIETDK